MDRPITSLKYVPPTLDEVQSALGESLVVTAHDCHRASLRLVRTGILPIGARVARGACKGVPGQHSWVSIGHPYDPDAPILDITRWSYIDQDPTVWAGSLRYGIHSPHGLGSIFDASMPHRRDGEIIDPPAGLSLAAKMFLQTLGPLDAHGWMELFNAPVANWPAPEIVSAAYLDPNLSAFIPIDRVGMLTDHNPGGMYW